MIVGMNHRIDVCKSNSFLVFLSGEAFRKMGQGLNIKNVWMSANDSLRDDALNGGKSQAKLIFSH